ncbi:MAG TPA: hypothetical protein VMU34_08570 [Mycobacterium sp.]|nr:hypothetical protein [Mycobacterium sp.]
MLALACASSLVLVDPVGIGPAWVHWVASLVALAAGAGVLVIANLSWQRAVATAQAAGLVASNDIELSRSRRLSRSQG